MIYTIENEHLKVDVDDFGAQLFSFYSKDTGVEYLWQGDAKYWTGRAYNLFPVIGRMFDGHYLAGNEKYELRCHGLARYYSFELYARTKNELTFLFRSSPETKKQYPYDFSFFVVFRIEGKKLTVLYRAKNEGEQAMYCGMGGHPGINIPFDGGKFEDYYLEFESATPAVRHTLSESKFMSGKTEPYPLVDGKKMPLVHNLFDDDAVVFGNTCGVCFLKGKHTSRAVKMEYHDYKYLGVWHMDKTDAPYVCLEPWSSLPSLDGEVTVLEKRENIFRLEKGQEKDLVYTLEILE